jgi:REP element-mobilizing transposase RayT
MSLSWADYNLHAHLVFVTKYRKDVFDDAMDSAA